MGKIESQALKVSGIWMGTSCKDEDGSSVKERKIKNFASEVAKSVRKPVSTIKIPFERNIQYEVERNVEVTEGFFIFKSTRMEKIKEQELIIRMFRLRDGF